MNIRHLFRTLVFLFLGALASAQTHEHLFPFPRIASGPSEAMTVGSDGNFYGTLMYGGIGLDGLVFKMTPEGVVTALQSLRYPETTGGRFPSGTLVEVGDGVFYGTASEGGVAGYGTAFRINRAGQLTTLHQFNSATGRFPRSGLVRADDGHLYGVAQQGGANDRGCVFRLTTAGALTAIYSFGAAGPGLPSARLVKGPDGALYGTASDIVFRVTTAGAFSTVAVLTNAQGSGLINPLVVEPDGNFYGTAFSGGGGRGTVFKVTPAGGVTVLRSLSVADGREPRAGLALGPDGNFYGTTSGGGSLGGGTLFRITPAGIYTVLRNCSYDESPSSGLVVRDGKLHGTAQVGTTGRALYFSLTTAGLFSVIAPFDDWNRGAFSTNGLTLARDGNFYGTAQLGSVIYKLTPSGEQSVVLRMSASQGTGVEGSMILASDGSLYGVTANGGAHNRGTIFRFTPPNQFTVLHDFTEAVYSSSGLVEGNDGNFYGALARNISTYAGSIYRITPQGVVSIIHNFTQAAFYTEGGEPDGPLLKLPDGNFIGTTISGGAFGIDGRGTIFRMTPAGAMTVLARLTYAAYRIQGGLVLGPGGNYYGVALYIGGNDTGTFVKCTPAGVFSVVATFGGAKGWAPMSAPVFGADGNFYGTASQGGNALMGLVYKMTPTGTQTVLKNFSGSDGAYPMAPLVFSEGAFYGSTYEGGLGGGGSLFRLVVSPSTTTTPATGMTFAGATLRGTVNPNGQSTTAGFELSTDSTMATGLQEVPAASSPGSGTSAVAISASATPLASNTTYYYRAKAGNVFGTKKGEILSFTTPLPPPTVTTVAATGIGLGSAVLNGLVKGNGTATTYAFEWGISPALDHATPAQALGNVTTTQLVSSVLPGLALNTTYAFRLRATNAGGAALGGTLTFSTPPLTVDGNGRYTLIAGKTWTLSRDEILPGDLRVEGTLVTGGFRLTVLGTVTVPPGGTITTPANVRAFFRDGAGSQVVDVSLGQLETVATLGLLGSQPMAKLLEGGDGWLYGTTASGGTAGVGTVFRMLRTGQAELLGNFTGANGANPQSALVGDVETGIFGTTTTGGAAGKGVIFRVMPQGGIAVVASFAGTDGAAPKGGLTLAADGALYGTASEGGALGLGTIFRVRPDSTIEKLADFDGGNGNRPQAPLFQASDGAFYGTATYGGANRVGVIYRFTPGGGIEVLWDFDGATGAYPLGAMIEGAPGAFLGTCYAGGTNNVGTVFRLGAGQAPTLGPVAVVATSFATPVGEGPIGPLTRGADGCFYGTAYSGVGGYGAIFKVTDGGTLTRVASVIGNAALIVGARPGGGLLLGTDGAFYGVSENGGDSGNGAVFRLLLSGTVENVVHFGGLPLPSTLTLDPDNGHLLGTTQRGGSIGYGSVFELAPKAGLTTLASFKPGFGKEPSPGAGVTRAADGTLFGTTTVGGLGSGVVWKLPPGGALAAPVSFDGTNGKNPAGGLVASGDGGYFGTTTLAGGFGNVFKVSPTGTLIPQGNFAGADGATPLAALVSDGAGAFLGTTRAGGTAGQGAIYRLKPGGGLALVASFTGANGAEPNAALVRDATGDFYGTTAAGGANSAGTIFKLTAAGALTTRHHFASTDGRAPRGALWPTGDGGFFGTTSQGGVLGKGTLFRLGALGPLETVSHFAAANDGDTPTTGLVAAGDGYLYGTSDTTVFRVPTGPSVTTLAAGDFSPTQTTLRGEVQARGLPTTVTFEWGTTPALGHTLAAGSTAGVNPVAVQATLAPLAAGGTYYYRVSASNVMGVRRGATLRFQMPNLIANGGGNYTLPAGAVWTLPGDFTVAGDLTILGSLDTAGHALTVLGKLIVNSPAVLLNATGIIAYRDRDGGLPPGVTRLLGDTAHDLLDSDGDGLNTLMEFALGTNPSNFSANALPVPGVVGGFLTLTYQSPAGITSVRVLVEASSDLVNWFSGPGFTDVTSDTISHDVRTVTVRATQAANPQYLRLRATR